MAAEAGGAALPRTTLGEVLAAHAAEQGERPFLIAPETGRTYTYADLAAQARRFAALLARRGIQPG